jgi:DNA-binding Lrp family transcriptional regulator
MDEIDEAIAELLEIDGRLTHREIAVQVGLSRSATATRVERLISRGQITVKGVIHPHVAGMHALAYVALTVEGAVADVAAAAAGRFEVPFVSIVSGPRPVVLELRVADAAAIAGLVNELRALDGVTSVDTLSYVDLVRDVAAPVGEVTVAIDSTDAKILRLLQEDGRCSYAEIARRLGMSPGGARRRVVRLLEGGVVRVGGVLRHSSRDRQSALGVGLRLSGDHRSVIDALQNVPGVIFIAHTLGRFDLLVTVRGFSNRQLCETLDRIRTIEGTGDVESWAHLDIVKESYAVTLP